jgi:hypothetical protein
LILNSEGRKWLFRAGSARISSARIGWARVGWARVGSARLGTTRASLGSTRIDYARLKLYDILGNVDLAVTCFERDRCRCFLVIP